MFCFFILPLRLCKVLMEFDMKHLPTLYAQSNRVRVRLMASYVNPREYITLKLTCHHINRRHNCFNFKSIYVHPLLWMNVRLDFICISQRASGSQYICTSLPDAELPSWIICACEELSNEVPSMSLSAPSLTCMESSMNPMHRYVYV